MAVMDILIRAEDQASQVLENVGQSGQQAASWIDRNWQKATLALGAAGAGAETLARRQAPLTEATERLAGSLGTSSGAVRDLAADMSDVTFPVEDVLDLMEIGRQRGLETEEQMREFAESMDYVGDATGLSAQQIAESTVYLERAGISADNVSEAYDAFGYITEQTTADVDEFNKFVGRAGEELGENTPHVNDMAAALGALEDTGMDAQRAQRQLQQALRETDGDLDAALESLGVTNEAYREEQEAVDGSSEVLERNAEAHEESYTTMERLQHAAEEMTYRYGDLVGVVGDLAPAMMALGPLMKGLSLGKAALAKVSVASLIPALSGAIASTWAWTAALLANPITWVVGLIVGLVAAIVLLWRNWDDVSAWLTESWQSLRERAGEFVEGVISWLATLPERAWEFLVNMITRFLEWRANMRDAALKAGQQIVAAVIEFLANLPGRAWEILTDALGRFGEFAANALTRAREAGQNVLDGVIDTISDLPSRVWGVFQDVVGRITDAGGMLWDAARGAASNIWEGFKGALGIRSPSHLERAMDQIMDKGKEMDKELRGDFGRVSQLDPDLGLEAPGRRREPGARDVVQRLDTLIALIGGALEQGVKVDLGALARATRGDEGALEEILDQLGSDRQPTRPRLVPFD